MDKITLTLKHDTVQHIACIIEDYIAYLHEELEMYKGSSRTESVNKYIKESEASLNELKSSIQQAKEKKWEFVPLYLLGVGNKKWQSKKF